MKIKSDPECQKNGGNWGPGEDQLNIRFHRMKERFGIDPQFPIQRYVDGLTKAKVPDRSSEHKSKLRNAANPGNGRDIAAYDGTGTTGTCTNPLRAKNVPRDAASDRCNLPRSARNPGLTFFAVLGGVPNELLHCDPTDADKSRLTPGDWDRILGRDPAKFNFEGIDLHMIATVSPRPGVPAPSDTRRPGGRSGSARPTFTRAAST